MTEREAIRRVKKLFKLYVKDEPHSEHYLYADAIKMSDEALEKQIPREPYRISGIDSNDNAIVDCPICKAGNDTSVKTIKHIYCWKCGQAIKWE